MRASFLFFLLGILALLFAGVVVILPRLSTQEMALLPSALPELLPFAPPQPSSAVQCEGCSDAPAVSVASPIAARSPVAGNVTHRLRYTPDPYTVLGGTAKYPHDLVREILERQRLGHLSFQLSMPGVAYFIQGTEERPGVYMVKPSDVVLSGNVTVTADFRIRYPTVTNAQFTFLRDKKDYRFVYGLIRGIVDHELRHHRVLTKYVSAVRDILASPLTEPLTIEASSRAAFDAKAQAELSRHLTERLQRADAEQAAANNDIDNPDRVARITFTFEEEVDGAVPPPIAADFLGEGNFSFVLPAGSVPRPPAPNIK